jgi:hypothetical protein
VAAAARRATRWIGHDAAHTVVDEPTRRALPFSVGVDRVPASFVAPRHWLLLAQSTCPAHLDRFSLVHDDSLPLLAAGRRLTELSIEAPPLALCWFSRP